MSTQRWQRWSFTLIAVIGIATLGLGVAKVSADEELADLGDAVPGDSGLALRLEESHLISEYTVLDLCDDAAVLDSGFVSEVELEETRLGLGVVCSRGDTKYLVESLVGGEGFLLDTEPTSKFMADLEERDRALLAENPRWLGAWTGTQSNRVDAVLGKIVAHADGLAVLESSLSIDKEGTIRGLIANLSESQSFDRARVSVDAGRPGSSSDAAPMIIQPGETLPFEVQTSLDKIPSVEDFSVRASRAQRADRVQRSVMVSPMATYQQDLVYVPEKYLTIAVDPETDERVEVIELTVSLREPHTRQKVGRLRNPIAVVAAVNAEGQVVEVHEVPVLDGSGDDGGNQLETLELGRDGRIGVVLGNNAISVSAWVSGSMGGK